jgi:hypothetical protein
MLGQGVTVFEEKIEHRRFNPVVVLVFVNSPLDLSVDTFSHAVPVVSEARI